MSWQSLNNINRRYVRNLIFFSVANCIFAKYGANLIKQQWYLNISTFHTSIQHAILFLSLTSNNIS